MSFIYKGHNLGSRPEPEKLRRLFRNRKNTNIDYRRHRDRKDTGFNLSSLIYSSVFILCSGISRTLSLVKLGRTLQLT